MLKLFYNFNRIFYFPLLNWFLPYLNSKVSARLSFEKEIRASSRSFKLDGLIADLAFEVSSEGEFEQVKPLLDIVLNTGKRVELIYCSESVDHKCKKLYDEFPEQLRILRLPLLTYNIFRLNSCPQRWLTAPRFFLCRYDFFPELIFYGEKSNVEFILLWGTLKNYKQKFPNNLFQRYVYKKFDKIVAATNLDYQLFIDDLKISPHKVKVFDFRPSQILNRLKIKESTLQKKVPQYPIFRSFLNEFPRHKRIIFGSFWENECDIFSGQDLKNLTEQGFIVVVVCHKLSENYKNSVASQIKKISEKPVYSIESMISLGEMQDLLEQFREHPGVIMMNLKGVLCELYSLFGHAFVGGGHGVSVHSLLEPFLSDAIVYCGPKVHRSTEYDLIRETSPDRINIVERLPELFPLINSFQILEYKSINGLERFYEEHLPKMLKWLCLTGERN